MAGIFALFAVRSFCWLLYNDGPQLMIQSPNNLGDLSLHITYIRDFANGSPLWPLNPIYPTGHLRYPAGVDLFNALLLLLHVELIPGLVWVGLLVARHLLHALFRWGGLFTVAGFLFNGGVVELQFFAVWVNQHTAHFVDFQGDESIAWKKSAAFDVRHSTRLALRHSSRAFAPLAVALSIFPTTRCAPASSVWVELSLCASLPLFHVHTFLALSVVLLSLFGAGHLNVGQLVTLVAGALIPATSFICLICRSF